VPAVFVGVPPPPESSLLHPMALTPVPTRIKVGTQSSKNLMQGSLQRSRKVAKNVWPRGLPKVSVRKRGDSVLFGRLCDLASERGRDATRPRAFEQIRPSLVFVSGLGDVACGLALWAIRPEGFLRHRCASAAFRATRLRFWCRRRFLPSRHGSIQSSCWFLGREEWWRLAEPIGSWPPMNQPYAVP
jgi:hypothetical protein